MMEVFFDQLKNENYNKKHKKDYYFLILNKDTKDIVVNSLKGVD